MKARIISIICLLGLFSILTGCIAQMGYLNRVIAAGAIGVGYGAIRSQKEGPTPLVTTPGPGPGPGPSLLPGLDLPWTFPEGSSTPEFTVTAFTGPFNLIQSEGGETHDYVAFYGMMTFDDPNGYDATAGLEYKIAYYDENNRLLFEDNFEYTMGYEHGDTVPFVTLYEPFKPNIKRAKVTYMRRISLVEGTDDIYKHWFGDFRLFNVSVSSEGVSGKIRQYEAIGTVDEEDPDPDLEREEVVVVAAFYNEKGSLIDVQFDDGGSDHTWDWGLLSLPGTDDKMTMAEFNVIAKKTFASYSLHIGFQMDRE